VSVLLDSVILIDHFNGIAQATRFIEREHRRLSISSITRAEVLAGFDESSVALAMALLDRFRFLPMDVAVADEAARIRRTSRLKLPDAIQAAFAVHHRLKLATRNVKDFPPARFTFVWVPYRVK